MVVAGGVQDELADDGACRGVGDGDVPVLDEHRNVGSGVGSADADVVQSPVVAQGDGAGGAAQGTAGVIDRLGSMRGSVVLAGPVPQRLVVALMTKLDG